MNTPLPIAVLISGTGSNLKALIDAKKQGLAIEFRIVISNQPEAPGLQYAQQANIPTRVLSHTQYPNRQAYDTALANLLDQYQPELIVLAGFMRKLTPEFVHQYYGKTINLHPALLPKLRGLNTFNRALEAGESEHGSSVHFVSADVDAGPIIAQVRFTIAQEDTADDLQRKTKALEHQLLPYVIKLFAQDQIQLKDHHVYLRSTRLPPEGTDLTEII